MSVHEDSELIELLTEQRDNVRNWIDTEAIETVSDQHHLIESSPERAYWHHGYQAALDDVIRQISAKDPAGCNAGKPN